MSYRGLGEPFTVRVQSADSIDLLTGSGEGGPEGTGWFRGTDVTGSDMPGYSTVIPYGQKDGVMTGGMPTKEQIAAGNPNSGFDFSAWIQQNKSTVYLAAGAFVLMSMFGGKGRR